MALSPAQVTTMKTFVTNSVDAAIVAARTAGATVALRDLLNADAAGPVKAWMTRVPQVVVDEVTNWTAFDALSQGKRDSWRMFFTYERDFTRNKVRSWVTDVWGNATGGSNAAAILLAGQENASVAENAIGGTVRSENSVSALDRAFVGDVTQEDCQKILA